MSTRRRCATPGCRHSPSTHDENGCQVCDCDIWADNRPHKWRADVHEAWLLATHAWWLERERVAVGYDTEKADFEEHHPRPRLADFMRAMSPGEPPEVLAELARPPVCASCCGTGHVGREIGISA